MVFSPSDFEVVPEIKVKCIEEGSGQFIKNGQIYSAWQKPSDMNSYIVNLVGQEEYALLEYRFEIVHPNLTYSFDPPQTIKSETIDHEELRLRKILTTRAVAKNMCIHCDVPLSVCVYHR